MYLAYGLPDAIRQLIKVFAITAIVAITAAALFFFLFIPNTPDASATEYSSNYEKIPAIERSPPRIGHWKYTPTVLICDYAPVDEIRVRSAVAFWERLNHKFYKTIYKQNHLNKCMSKSPKGFIVVKLVSQQELIGMEPTTLAQTHFYVDNQTGQIEWALIYLRKEPDKLVLEHEIGHALGFLHYNKVGHLMHEKIILGGWNTVGLDN